MRGERGKRGQYIVIVTVGDKNKIGAKNVAALLPKKSESVFAGGVCVVRM